jgi:hypothetical protein
MNIRVSRTAAAVVFASALVAAGLVLAAPSKKPATASRGQQAEYASMCKYCENATNGACYAYAYQPGAAPAASLLPDAGADAGMSTEGACTYPPCAPVNMMMKGTSLAELKLVCASCRAMCPNTSGAPGSPETGKAPDQRR